MPQAIEEKERLFAELDRLTEYDIEARLRTAVYHPEDKRKLVELYLEQQGMAAEFARAIVLKSAGERWRQKLSGVRVGHSVNWR